MHGAVEFIMTMQQQQERQSREENELDHPLVKGRSVFEVYGFHSGSRCGYCGNQDTWASFGTESLLMKK